MLDEAEKRGASPDELPSPKRIRTSPRQDPSINNLPEPMKTEETSLESDSGSESTTSSDDKDELDVTTENDDERYMIEELIGTPSIVRLANEVLEHQEIVQALEELLQTLDDDAHDKLNNRAINCFDKVKNIWRNICLIGVLLRARILPSMMHYRNWARTKLSKFLMRKIKSEPSFEDIYKYLDDASMMRNALSILIGYWSNEDMIVRLVSSMGGHSFGVNCVSDDDYLSVAKGENTLACVEERCENIMCMGSSTPIEGMPVHSPIADLRQDASITELADQLLKIPEAVTLAQEVLKSLQVDVPERKTPLYHYNARHEDAAVGFWFNPLIIMQLIKSLKQELNVYDVWTK